MRFPEYLKYVAEQMEWCQNSKMASGYTLVEPCMEIVDFWLLFNPPSRIYETCTSMKFDLLEA